jgi:hypothetical protein
MREGPGAGIDAGAGSEREGLKQPGGGELDRKFRIAMVLYAILAALSWFTLDGKIPVEGRLVELKLIPLFIIGAFALRTVVAMKAEKIRPKGPKGGRFVPEVCCRADVAQLVEHSLGKGEVTSSILVISSRNSVNSGQ